MEDSSSPTGSTPNAASCIDLKLDYSKVVSFARQQTGLPLLHSACITNGTAEVLTGAELVIRPDPVFAAEKIVRLADVIPGGVVMLDTEHLDIPFSTGFLSAQRERIRGTLNMELRCGDAVKASCILPLAVLAYNEWSGLEDLPEVLAAFSTPNQPAVARLLGAAAKHLAKTTGNPALDGYQSKDSRRVFRIVEAIFNAIKDADVVYCVPPASFEQSGQKIRFPEEVLGSRLGTCLDTALLFASALEASGLKPILVMDRGHAYAGCWMEPCGFELPVLDDLQQMRKLTDGADPKVIVFETTVASSGNTGGFSTSEAQARKHIHESEEFRFAIDIARARDNRILPLPVGIKDGCVVVDIPVPRPSGGSQAVSEETLDARFHKTVEETAQDALPKDRLAYWANQLLDLSLRNRLLNFGRSKSLRVHSHAIDILEDKLAENAEFTILPAYEDETRDAALHNKRHGEDLDKERLSKELDARKLRVACTKEELDKRLLTLAHDAKLSLEESGANTLFLAVGVMEWQDVNQPGARGQKVYSAPILLVPVTLMRQSVRSGYKLRRLDEETRVNVTLLEKLKRDFEIEVKGVNPPPEDESGVDVPLLLKRFRNAVLNSKGFYVKDEAHLGIFQFTKFLLWKDLMDRTDELRKNPVVKHLIDTPRNPYLPPEGVAASAVAPQVLDDTVHPAKNYCIMDADSSQLSAVASASAGLSFVMIGPPGTGKSQTISNIIATLIAMGKTVLFVAEKRAALEVVQHRLEKAGLGPFLLEVHSNKSGKAEIIDQFRKAVEFLPTKPLTSSDTKVWYDWDASGNRLEVQSLSPTRRIQDSPVSDWDRYAANLHDLRNALNTTVRALHKRLPNGYSAYRCHGILVGVGNDLPRLAFRAIDSHTPETLTAMRRVIGDISLHISEISESEAKRLTGIRRKGWSPAWESDSLESIALLNKAIRAMEKARIEFEDALGLNLGKLSIRQLDPLVVHAKTYLCAPPVTETFVMETDGTVIEQSVRNGVDAIKSISRVKDLWAGWEVNTLLEAYSPDVIEPIRYRNGGRVDMLKAELNTLREELGGLPSSLLSQGSRLVIRDFGHDMEMKRISAARRLRECGAELRHSLEEVCAPLDVPVGQLSLASIRSLSSLLQFASGMPGVRADFIRTKSSDELLRLVQYAIDVTDVRRKAYEDLMRWKINNLHQLQALSKFLSITIEMPSVRSDFIRTKSSNQLLQIVQTAIEASDARRKAYNDLMGWRIPNLLQSDVGELRGKWSQACNSWILPRVIRKRSFVQQLTRDYGIGDLIVSYSEVDEKLNQIEHIQACEKQWLDADAHMRQLFTGYWSDSRYDEESLILAVEWHRDFSGQIQVCSELRGTPEDLRSRIVNILDAGEEAFTRGSRIIDAFSRHSSLVEEFREIIANLFPSNDGFDISNHGDIIYSESFKNQTQKLVDSVLEVLRCLDETSKNFDIGILTNIIDTLQACEKRWAKVDELMRQRFIDGWTDGHYDKDILTTAVDWHRQFCSRIEACSRLPGLSIGLRERMADLMDSDASALRIGGASYALSQSFAARVEQFDNALDDACTLFGFDRADIEGTAPYKLFDFITPELVHSFHDALRVLHEAKADFDNVDRHNAALLGKVWNAGQPQAGALEAAVQWHRTMNESAKELSAQVPVLAQQFRSRMAKTIAITPERLNATNDIHRFVNTYATATGEFYRAFEYTTGLLEINRTEWATASTHALLDYLGGIQSAAQTLRKWCRLNELRAQAREMELTRLLDTVDDGTVQAKELVAVFEKAYARACLNKLVNDDPILQKFFKDEHSRRIEEFRELDVKLTKLAGQVVQALAASRRPKTTDSRDRMVDFGEVGILHGEMSKKRRHKAIRQLFTEIPTILPRLKPCLLMSPLSVAQYLDAEHPRFDAVIFDEASQVPVCDAIGAMARGTQVIITGDPQQLPPTSFFQRGSRNEEEPDAEYQEIPESAESILDECDAAGLTKIDLAWHYRSRHESLIAFSNHHYYGNRLLTNPEAAVQDKGVRFHYVGGVYDRGGSQTNKAEAHAIVAAISAHYKNPEMNGVSIGVVTFNSQQANLIETLLDEACLKDSELDTLISAEAREPLFIKNLENVQGDERDIIVFSTTFGRDAAGVFYNNFGPINAQGGERRLNVAITRARLGVEVYSSMRAEDIDLSKSRAVGARHLKAYLDYAARGRNALPSIIRSEHTDLFDSEFERKVAEALRSQGWEIHTQIGCSAYRIDMAVVHPEHPGAYAIGIECDGATYHRSATARDRDRLRQSVLEGLGWSIHRVWSTEWFHNMDREKTHLFDAVRKAIADYGAKPQKSVTLPTPVAPAQEPVRIASNAATSSAPKPASPKIQDARAYKRADVLASAIKGMNPYETESVEQLRAAIQSIVQAEGPVSVDQLCSRVAEMLEMKRATTKLAERLLEAMPRNTRKTVSGESTYLWPEGLLPDAYRDFRTHAESHEERRVIRDICPQEQANAMEHIVRNYHSIPTDDLLRQTVALFGYGMLSQQMRDDLKPGLRLLCRRMGIVKADDDYALV